MDEKKQCCIGIFWKFEYIENYFVLLSYGFFLFFFFRNYKLLEKYFEPSCETVFQKGLALENFVPPPPTASPSDQPNKAPNKTGKEHKG